MGLGFTIGLGTLGAFRELLGFGTILGYDVLSKINKLLDYISKVDELDLKPITVIGLAPGAFFVLAGLVAIQNAVKNKKAKKNNEKIAENNCTDCSSCNGCKGGLS